MTPKKYQFPEMSNFLNNPLVTALEKIVPPGTMALKNHYVPNSLTMLPMANSNHLTTGRQHAVIVYSYLESRLG